MGNQTNRELQAKERKKQIQQSAKTLFSANGYYNTSIREIADTAGIASGLIYHYFPEGKQQMLSSIVEQGSCDMLNSLKEGMEHINSADLSFKEGLIYISNKMSNIFLRDPDLTKILFFEIQTTNLDSFQELKRLFPENKELLMSFLRKKAESGEIKDVNFDITGVVLTRLIFTTTLNNHLKLLDFKEEFGLDASINFIVDLLSAK